MMPNGTRGWLELHDLSFHPQQEAVSPKGLYIDGKMAGENNFMPTSGIKGSPFADMPPQGTTPGWVELNGLKFISDVTAVSPMEPYVKGVQDEEGKFYPNEPHRIVGGPEY
jgi:hypothetical protein